MSKRVAARSAGGVEYRTVPLGDTGVTDDGSLNGLAVRFDSQTQIGDPEWGFRESFPPGAFTKTLAESDLVLLDNHDTARPIARKSAGTLQASQSDGLRWDAQPTSQASYINDVRENVKAKNYGGCSFGFRAVKEDWLDDDGKPSNAMFGTQRVVREAQLFEISVCTFPAYGDTEVMTRDAVSALRETRAAKATWDDLDTCAECGSENQYGQYCSNCGEPMTQPKPSSNFCPQCGSSLDGTRSHECGETRDESAAESTDTNDGSSEIPKPEDSTSEPFDIRFYKFRLMESKGDE